MPIEQLHDGNGSTTDFAVGIDYTARAFVKVYVDDVLQVETTQYAFLSDDDVRFVTPPPNGTDNVKFLRETSTTPLVDFTAGGSILDTDLDTAIGQMMDISEEQASEDYVDARVAAAAIDPSIVVSSFSASLLNNTTTTSWVSGLGASTIGALNFFAANGITAIQNMGVTSYESFGIIGNADAAAHRAYHGIDEVIPNPNLIPCNADFQLWQETGATNANVADAAYFADQWINVSNGNTPDYDQIVSSLPDNAVSGLKVTANTTDGKFGFHMPLESKLSVPLRSKTVTLSVDIQNQGSPLTGWRMHLYEWVGTADAVPKEIIGTWNALNDVPTGVTSLNIKEPTVTDAEEFNVDGTWTTYSATFEVTAGTSVNNVGVFICTNDSSFASASEVHFSKVKIEYGDVATPFAPQRFSADLAEAQRFYEKTFEYDVVPAEAAGTGTGELSGRLHNSSNSGSTYNGDVEWRYRQEKFANPTVVTYNPVNANANFYDVVNAADMVLTTHKTDKRTSFATPATGGAGAVNGRITIHMTAESRITV